MMMTVGCSRPKLAGSAFSRTKTADEFLGDTPAA
jgi:hypothetical protein